MRGRRSRTTPALAGVALLLGSLLLACLACGGPSGEPIRIAFAGPVSGPGAHEGQSSVRAIQLVIDRANEAGGVLGRPLALDVYDDANDPERARANAPGIADQARTVAVIGHNRSSCAVAAGPLYAERSLPVVATAATSLAVTADNDWYFRTIYNDRDQGQLLALYVDEVLAPERFALVHGSTDYARTLGDVLADSGDALGLRLDGRYVFDVEAPDLEAQLVAIAAALLAAPPPVVVLASQPEAGAAFVRLLRDGGFAGALVVSDALASSSFASGFAGLPNEIAEPGFYTDGIYASTPFLFDTAGPRAAEFMRDYIERYDRAPDWYAAFAADAASAVIESLRRSGKSGDDPADVLRRAVRDELAGFSPEDPLEGLTGATWFDENGDAAKPVPMGRFRGNELVSAFTQLRLAEPGQSIAHLDPARVVRAGDRVLLRTDVARVGTRVRRFGELDFSAGVFEADFDIWFRHEGDRNVEDIVFTNAIEPLSLGEPLDEVVEGPLHYRRYHTSGRFRADTFDAPYGEHSIAFSFHHRSRTRDELILAIDALGMDLGAERTLAERVERGRRLLGPNSDWRIKSILSFEEPAAESALGHPAHVLGGPPVRRFSQLNVAGLLGRHAIGLRGIVPRPYLVLLLAGAAGGLLALLALRGRGRPALRFAVQAALSVLLLIVAEPLLGDRAKGVASHAQLSMLTRVFDVLWWVVPAFLLNAAVYRFVWQPAEQRTERPVPTLLRYSVASVIYALAFFGVVAFVWDYKLTGLLATSGVLAMIIGLGVQLNITNIFAGVALNLEHPFRVGDWIMVHGRTPEPDNGIIGMVIDINWRTTRLQTTDDTVVVIPNGVISEKTITNFQQPGEISRFELYFTVGAEFAPARVIPVIQAAVKAVTGAGHKGPLEDPPPKVSIRETNERGVEYMVRYRLIPRLVSPAKARHTINDSVLRHLRDADIPLAVLTTEIRAQSVSAAEAERSP